MANELKPREVETEQALIWARRQGYSQGETALNQYCSARGLIWSEDYAGQIWIRVLPYVAPGMSLEKLSHKLAQFCRDTGLEPASADEMLARLKPAPGGDPRAAWLSRFIDAWESDE